MNETRSPVEFIDTSKASPAATQQALSILRDAFERIKREGQLSLRQNDNTTLLKKQPASVTKRVVQEKII